MRNLNLDLDYLLIFICKQSQLAGCIQHGLLPVIGNLRCCNNTHWGNKGLCHSSMDVCWQHDIALSKIKSHSNCHCQLTCDDWGIPKRKAEILPVCIRCTTVLPKQAEILLCITTCNLWIWIVLFILHYYKTSLSTWWLFLCIWDFGRESNQNGSGCSGIHREFCKLPPVYRGDLIIIKRYSPSIYLFSLRMTLR